MNSKKSVLINFIIIGVIIFGFLIINFFTSTPTQKTLSFESAALQISLKPLKEGTPEIGSLKSFQGQNLVLHFWASYCEACAQDEQNFERLAKEFEGNSTVKFVGIASNDKKEDIENSKIIAHSKLHHYLEETGDLALALGVKSLPQTLVINSKGQVLMQLTRAFDENQFAHMEDRINSLSELSVPHFNFEGTHEKRVSDQTFKGNVWVADFIFTSCPNQCPMLTAKMKLLQEEFKNISHFKMLSLSVAPEVDTAEVLLKYETKYQVNPENWYFARGPIEGVKNLLVNGFKLGTMDDPQFHTGKFVLIDPSNVIRGYYDPDNSESFEKLKNEIRKLLH